MISPESGPRLDFASISKESVIKALEAIDPTSKTRVPLSKEIQLAHGVRVQLQATPDKDRRHRIGLTFTSVTSADSGFGIGSYQTDTNVVDRALSAISICEEEAKLATDSTIDSVGGQHDPEWKRAEFLKEVLRDSLPSEETWGKQEWHCEVNAPTGNGVIKITVRWVRHNYVVFVTGSNDNEFFESSFGSSTPGKNTLQEDHAKSVFDKAYELFQRLDFSAASDQLNEFADTIPVIEVSHTQSVG